MLKGSREDVHGFEITKRKKTPSTNIQAPEKLKTPNFNSAIIEIETCGVVIFGIET
jgi:hypothetical protein